MVCTPTTIHSCDSKTDFWGVTMAEKYICRRAATCDRPEKALCYHATPHTHIPWSCDYVTPECSPEGTCAKIERDDEV